MRVRATGPTTPGTLFFLGEGPGVVESKVGWAFQGPAGDELNRYLNGLQLPHRDDCYVTNLYKEWAGGGAIKSKEPTQEDLDLSEWELHLELQAVKPRLVVALGRWSTRWLIGAVDMDAVHGLLYQITYCPGCGARWRSYADEDGCVCIGTTYQTFYVLPVVHPAAGMHNSVMAAHTAYDMAQLAVILNTPQAFWESRCWKPGVKGTYVLGPQVWNHQLEAGLDTEGQIETPWGWSASFAQGTGSVYKAGVHSPFGPDWMDKIRWVLHNYMWDSKVCTALGMPIPQDHFDDTQVMAFLLGVEPQALKDLSHRWLGFTRPGFLDLFAEKIPQYGKPGEDRLKVDRKTGVPTIIPGKPGKLLKKTKTVIHTMDDGWQPEGVVVDYAGQDADDTLQVKQVLWPRIQALGLEEIYHIDISVLPLYSRMEEVGLPVNLEHYADFSHYLAEELEVKTALLHAEYPGLNPGSADQVAEIMYGHLGIPGGKKTKSGKRFTTNDKIMEALKESHPFVAAIIEWRELAKLKSTFVDALPKHTHYGRLLFQLLPTRVVSGRLAAKNPNALAFPKYTVLGKRFRAGVQAPPGRALGSWDLNQIELRVLALDSGSVVLRNAFLTGEDLHYRTALKVFNKPGRGTEGSHPERVAAKAVNFGIPMGLTEVGLAEQMRKHGYKFPELAGKHFATQQARYEAQAKVCQQWIAATIADWGIEGYIKAKHAEARRFGYVSSRGGRLRFLPSVLSPNKQIREAAQREAQAYGPQAGARFFMKQIESRVWREIIQPMNAEGPSAAPYRGEGPHWGRIEPCLDIHDDLLLEFDEDLGPLLHPLIESMVAASFDTEIPITAKGAIGKKWSEV